MSRTPANWRVRPLRDWTLRSRLIASFLGLLLITCAGIGIFTELALRQSLINQLDKQLVSAGNLSISGPGGGPRPGHSSPGGGPNLLPRGIPIASIGARIVNGTVADSAYQDSDNIEPSLTDAVQQRLLTVP